jgi:hypothetical protein
MATGSSEALNKIKEIKVKNNTKDY